MVVQMSVKRQALRKQCTPNSSNSPASVAAGSRRFKGVRRRSWGRWVSEIRLPNSPARLWLGSFATAEQAARAFDVAIVCLRGPSASLNFPDSPPSHAPFDLSHHEIVELAAVTAATYPSSAIPETISQLELMQQKNPSSTAGSKVQRESSLPYEQSPCSSISSDLPSDSDLISHISAESLDELLMDSSCSGEQTDSIDNFLQIVESDEPEEETPSKQTVPSSLHYLEEEQFDRSIWSFFSSMPYSSLDQQLFMPPPPPEPEDEFSTTVEPCLWDFSTDFLSSSILCC